MADEQENDTSQPETVDSETIEHEKEELLEHVGASETETMIHKVAWLMNHYPRTRNSDIELQIRYWQEFEKFHGDYVPLKDLFTLTRLTSISRARAKIQNQYRLFLADPQIRQHRGTLEESEREKARETPDYPVYKVYLDESGKTSPYLVVGSLWFLSSGREGLDLYLEVKKLKETRNFSGEFHFRDMTREEVDIYKELIDIFLTKGGTISFKFISLPRHGIGNIQAALVELFYHLLIKGIDHEDSTGRAPLPRIIQAWKDLESGSSDKIVMANVSDRLKQAAASVYGNKLFVENFVAMDSKKSTFIQVADIMASSVNRILCRSEATRGYKDELADYLMSRLGVHPTSQLESSIGDMAVHLSL
jgi:hypothetical protein